MENNTNIVRKNPSKAWYLLPIFFGLLGGLIMFFVLKDENRQMAKNGVILNNACSSNSTGIYLYNAFSLNLSYRLENLICKESFFGNISFFDSGIIREYILSYFISINFTVFHILGLKFMSNLFHKPPAPFYKWVSLSFFSAPKNC